MATGDVRDEAFARSLVDMALRHFGKLDIAFNNAGTNGEMGPMPGISLDGWNQTLAINLTAAFLVAKYQIPAMLEGEGGSEGAYSKTAGPRGDQVLYR